MVDVLLPEPAPSDVDRPPMVASLSPSSMATWRRCPKRFFFEKILRLETDTGEPAVCGSFVHVVLEHLMALPAGGRTPEAAREVATAVWPAFIADPESRFAELALDTAATVAFKRRAWAGILGYFAIEDPRRVEVVGTEEEVKADLAGAPVYGIIDRVDQGPDGLVVTDYKSGKAPAWDDERAEKLGQLRTYAALLEATGRTVAELRLLFVSPHVAARARLERCQAAAVAATQALAAAVPEAPAERLEAALAEVDAAHRHARESAADRLAARVASREAATAAARAEAEALAGPVRAEELAVLVEAAFAARRKAFFARRAAGVACPTSLSLRVREEDLEMARVEARTIWDEASACYDAWDFPGRPSRGCDWCPFADRCDAFAAWQAAAAE